MVLFYNTAKFLLKKSLKKDDATVSATKAGNEEAFLPLEERVVVVDPGNPQEDTMILSFFPTAEGCKFKINRV